MKFSVTATAVAHWPSSPLLLRKHPQLRKFAFASNSTSELTKRADCFGYTLTKYNTATSGKDFSPGQNAQVASLPGINVAYNTNNMELTVTVKGKAYQHKKANSGGTSIDYLFTDIHEYWGCMSALP
ncbi:hypothetical protein BG003_000234 [Podila horticola]|nr:hypothetical protein BG003_000234 [Podila horticola]